MSDVINKHDTLHKALRLEDLYIHPFSNNFYQEDASRPPEN